MKRTILIRILYKIPQFGDAQFDGGEMIRKACSARLNTLIESGYGRCVVNQIGEWLHQFLGKSGFDRQQGSKLKTLSVIVSYKQLAIIPT